MECGMCPVQLKQARVLPLLKKSTLDPYDASSYRSIPISCTTLSLANALLPADFPTTYNLSPVPQNGAIISP